MRRHLLLAFASLAALCAAASAPATAAGPTESGTGKIQEEIKGIERERNQAILAGDVAALDRMTSEDYTFITQRGELRTKAEILRGFKSGSFRYGAFIPQPIFVRVSPNIDHVGIPEAVLAQTHSGLISVLEHHPCHHYGRIRERR